MVAILLAIVVGTIFYTTVIAAVSYVAPWQSIVHERFATAVAFERALGSRWIVRLIMAAALLSLLKVFNGNLVAASRMLFALGRRELADTRLGYVHPLNRTPSIAIVCIGTATAAVTLGGQSLLVPITEVGSLAAALGWMASCAAYLGMRPSPLAMAAAATGLIVTALMILMKVLPQAPGHFSVYEWIALAIWVVLGALLRRKREPAVGPDPR